MLADELDYIEWLRYNSFPCGQIMPDTYRNFPNRETEGNELFTDKTNATTGRLPDHAKARLRDVRRIESGGSLKKLHRLIVTSAKSSNRILRK